MEHIKKKKGKKKLKRDFLPYIIISYSAAGLLFNIVIKMTLQKITSGSFCSLTHIPK